MSTQYKSILKKTALLLGLYSCIRILFYLFNYKTYAEQNPTALAYSFLHGVRFDLSTILMLNFLIFSTMAWPRLRPSSPWATPLTRGLFIILNSIFILPSIVDLEFYKFTGARLTWDILIFRGDAGHQMDQFLIHYWYIFALGLISVFSIWQISRFIQPKTKAYNRKAVFLKQMPALFILASLMVVGIRGGLQKKPLQPAHAYLAGNSDLGLLSLNSGFTVLRSQIKPQLSKAQFFSTDEEAFQHLAPRRLDAPIAVGKGQNVVVIILESMASEFWGAIHPEESYTPFLDELVPQGLFFKNNFANGRRSIDALPAILFGIPSYMSTPIFKSSYQNGNWIGLGTVLKSAGYHTSFFHGAPKGTMYFDAISARAGLSDYYPLERYKGNLKTDFDGNWGIFDEPMLQFMADELSQHRQPFFSVGFTISTHQPYHVPPEYRDKLTKGPMQIHQSVRYVDLALRRFFDKAKTMPWYNNTLFIITADHTQMSESKNLNHMLSRFSVPLLLFHPQKKIGLADTNRITQHTDLYSSVLDYLGIPNERLPRFGKSVFSKDHPGSAMFFSQGSYWLVKGQHFVELTEGKNSLLFAYPQDAAQKTPLLNDPETTKNLETELKANLQYFRNGLISNKIF